MLKESERTHAHDPEPAESAFDAIAAGIPEDASETAALN